MSHSTISPDLFEASYLVTTKSPQVEAESAPLKRAGADNPSTTREDGLQPVKYLREPVTTKNWHRFTRCDSADVDILIPDRESSKAPPEVLELCSTCPVRNFCLQEALDSGACGYWAGTTTGQRRKLKRGNVTADEYFDAEPFATAEGDVALGDGDFRSPHATFRSQAAA